MQLQDLYIKSINRPVNPAVSATKFDKETIDIEIKEYVFPMKSSMDFIAF